MSLPRTILLASLLGLWAGGAAYAAPSSPEGALAALLARHAELLEAGDGDGAADLCRRAIDSKSLGAFAPVADILLGADLLALGRADEGAKILAKRLLAPGAATPADPVAAAVAAAADTHARRWLTRLDREKVVAALKGYYAENVRYPDSLDALRGTKPAPPFRDRWGDPWNYRLDHFRALKGVAAQRYVLESRGTPRASDLRKALGARSAPVLPDGWKAARGRDGSVVIEDAPGARSIVRPGSLHAGVRFVCFAGRAALFSSGDGWALLPLSPGGTP